MENVSKQEIEWDEEHEENQQDDHQQDGDDEICIATKTDGNPCLGLRYKNTDYCYAHLSKMKLVPKTKPQPVDPTLLPKRGRPKKVQIAPVAPITPAVPSAPVAPVASAPVTSVPLALHSVGQAHLWASPQPTTLESKLLKKLKDKLDKLDTDTKMLLQCLL